MKAIILKSVQSIPKLEIWDKPQPKHGFEIVKLNTASINRRDYWIIKGKYPGIKVPIILGSDGVGVLNGEKVIFDPGTNWGDNLNVQSGKYQILGLPAHGTFAEFVRVKSENIYPKPPHLSDSEAAALPLAGVTAYRALFTKCKLTQSDKVLISGVGGGVASMAMQFALAIDCDVYVTSGHEEKLDKAKNYGAKGGVNYKDSNWVKDLARQVKGGFDVIIDSAGGSAFNNLMKLTNEGARIGIYGGTLGKISLSPQILFWRQVSIFGTTMGCPNDFELMLKFIEKKQIKPIVDKVFELNKFEMALKRMEQSKQFGKIILKIS